MNDERSDIDGAVAAQLARAALLDAQRSEAAMVAADAAERLVPLVGRERAWLAIVYAAMAARGDAVEFAVQAWNWAGEAEDWQARRQGANEER